MPNGARTRENFALFWQSAAADAVFYIQKGKVKVVVASKEGKEAVVGVMNPGDFFGEGYLVGQPLRLATAKAMTECQVVRVSKAEMVRVLHAEPSFAELFITHLLTRNSRVEDNLVDQLFNSSEKRLARTLLLLANFGQDGGPQPVTTPISQETLAESSARRARAGGSLHASRTLNRFKVLRINARALFRPGRAG